MGFQAAITVDLSVCENGLLGVGTGSAFSGHAHADGHPEWLLYEFKVCFVCLYADHTQLTSSLRRSVMDVVVHEPEMPPESSEAAVSVVVAA